MNDKQLTWEEAVRWLKSQSDRQDLVEACYYDDPLIDAAERFTKSEEWQAVYEITKNWLPGKVLDLGAGRGISSYAFAKVGCQVTALEPDPSSLVGAGAIQSLFKQTDFPIQIIREYGETLPFPDRTFDIVYGRAVLHHAQDLPKLCREAARVLKQGGIFLATREHVISKPEDLQTFLDSHALHFLYGGENAYLLKQYRQCIVESGLVLRKIYGSLDSVINYAPMSFSQCQTKFFAVLQKYLGTYLARSLTSRPDIISVLSRCYTLSDRTPGRLYSFVAVKPCP
jgi:ubiquinone/menaquinone biosynthesis C-methylase UbiE